MSVFTVLMTEALTKYSTENILLHFHPFAVGCNCLAAVSIHNVDTSVDTNPILYCTTSFWNLFLLSN